MRWFKWFGKVEVVKPDRYKMTVRLRAHEVIEKPKKTRKRTKNKTVSFIHIVHQDRYELKQAIDLGAHYYKSKGYYVTGYYVTEDSYSPSGFYVELAKISNEREFIANFDHKLVDSKHSSVNIRTW